MKMSKIHINREIISSFFSGVLFTIIIFSSIYSILPKKSLNSSISRVDDAVVSIEVYDDTKLTATGTGFAYKKDKKYTYIMTNEHVICGNTIKVINSNDEQQTAKVLGKDAYLDVAILRVDKKFIKEIASLGNSEKIRLGDRVFTITTPIGKRYSGSVTSGIVSGKNRIVPVNSFGDNSEWIINAIQFDAHINPGSSGGALFDKKGSIIGLCTMKIIQEGIEGMAFATPIEMIKPVLSELEKNKKLKRPELGIKMVEVDNELELSENDITISDDIFYGVVILDTKESSSSDGILEKGDVLLKINEDEIPDMSFVKYYLYQYKIGDKIKLTINRGGIEKVITLTLK